MDVYSFSLTLGGAGLLFMGLRGLGHSHTADHGSHGGHAGHNGGHSHGHNGGHSHGHDGGHNAGHNAGHTHGHNHAQGGSHIHMGFGERAISLLSPRVLFSFLLGLGTT